MTGLADEVWSELVLVAEVPVQRHRGNAQLGGKPPDRHRLQAVLITNRQAALDNRGPAQPRPVSFRCLLRRIHLACLHQLTTIHRTCKARPYPVHSTGTGYMDAVRLRS